ncbi:hypothetical protein C4K23_0250 [Pseudomonas chlororaphis]|nr:hypothetical protein C4K23_0250 [Pseudomonas chlororaphis]
MAEGPVPGHEAFLKIRRLDREQARSYSFVAFVGASLLTMAPLPTQP